MAEKGAYLTGTSFVKPSIFEIVAQESLASTLEPTFKRLFSFFISCNPERYGHLLRWADEGYLIFNTILQQYYFKKYSATFSESFYGLKRVPIGHPNGKGSMSVKQGALSLALTILLPYAKSKLIHLREEYQFDETETHSQETKWDKWLRPCIAQGCTVALTLYESMVLYTYLLYLSGKSVYPTPLLRLLSVTLTYARNPPSVAISELLQKLKTNTFGISDGVIVLESTLTTLIEFGAFFLQFLSWWSQEENYSSITALPVPPPPKIPEEAAHYKGICPICEKPQHIKTVLPISGYVFCYQCILFAIRENGKCPVTNYPAKEDDLIRLYL